MALIEADITTVGDMPPLTLEEALWAAREFRRISGIYAYAVNRSDGRGWVASCRVEAPGVEKWRGTLGRN